MENVHGTKAVEEWLLHKSLTLCLWAKAVSGTTNTPTLLSKGYFCCFLYRGGTVKVVSAAPVTV